PLPCFPTRRSSDLRGERSARIRTLRQPDGRDQQERRAQDKHPTHWAHSGAMGRLSGNGKRIARNRRNRQTMRAPERRHLRHGRDRATRTNPPQAATNPCLDGTSPPTPTAPPPLRDPHSMPSAALPPRPQELLVLPRPRGRRPPPPPAYSRPPPRAERRAPAPPACAPHQPHITLSPQHQIRTQGGPPCPHPSPT